MRRKSAMNDTVKKVRKMIAAGDAQGAAAMMPQAYKVIDKAAKRGVIKDNTAARKKSRLSAALKQAKK